MASCARVRFQGPEMRRMRMRRNEWRHTSPAMRRTIPQRCVCETVIQYPTRDQHQDVAVEHAVELVLHLLQYACDPCRWRDAVEDLAAWWPCELFS